LYGKDAGVHIGDSAPADYRLLAAFVGFQLDFAPDNFLDVMSHMENITSIKQVLHLSFLGFFFVPLHSHPFKN